MTNAAFIMWYHAAGRWWMAFWGKACVHSIHLYDQCQSLKDTIGNRSGYSPMLTIYIYESDYKSRHSFVQSEKYYNLYKWHALMLCINIKNQHTRELISAQKDVKQIQKQIPHVPLVTHLVCEYQALIDTLVCWLCLSTLGLTLFEIVQVSQVNIL